MPPSTGAPPNSVNIGFTELAWPTQTATVMSWVAPTNQASPLFSVVPVLPHSAEAPVAAFVPVPWETTVSRMPTGPSAATSGEMTCSVSTLSWPGSPVLVVDHVAAQRGRLVADLLDPDRARRPRWPSCR